MPEPHSVFRSRTPIWDARERMASVAASRWVLLDVPKRREHVTHRDEKRSPEALARLLRRRGRI
jgi:hypothetical protein